MDECLAELGAEDEICDDLTELMDASCVGVEPQVLTGCQLGGTGRTGAMSLAVLMLAAAMLRRRIQ